MNKNTSLWVPGCGLFRNLKFYYQRATRGWADCDAWSIDSYLDYLLPPFIRSLKGGCGCPSEFYDATKENNECWKWDEALESMAQGFEASEAISNLKYYKTVEVKGGTTREIDEMALQNLTEKYNKGMDLFRQYYMSLWD